MIIFLAILGYPVDSGHSMGEPESSGAARYARRLMMKRNLASAHKGSRLKSASALLLMIAAGGSHAQVRLPPITSAPKSVCAAAQDSPTWKNCWECYKDLISDCTETFDTLDERKSCYHTAHTFYQICMGQTVGAARSPSMNIVIPQPMRIDLRTTTTLEVTTLVIVDPARISVYLVSRNDDGARVIDIDSETDVTSDDWVTFEILVNPAMLDLQTGELIGLIVAVNDIEKHIPIDADTIVLTVTDSYDLNYDGTFDARDYVAAIVQFSKGEIDADTFYDLAGALRSE